MSGIVYIVSAPSGSGKSTLTAEMLRIVPGLEFSISYTTRKPRGSERNGVEYFFVPREDFERMIRNDDFLEYACVFGDYYGTSKHFVDAAKNRGNDLLLDIDVQGAAQVKKRLPQAISIFILPPSRGELERRLRRRSQAENFVDEAVITRRLNTAGQEIENYPTYDYILVNDQLEHSIDELKAIILAERMRRSGESVSGEAKRILDTAEHCRIDNVQTRVQQILQSFAERGAAQKG